ncbi:thioesterase-like protein [Azospirillum brasilense]|uniref:Thioesterase family protein n=1 Tax=Azospirillum brasilense TaxID=192 RepID=A0A0P0EN10_AZOBR|nr:MULTISPECIES: thioesterase family protein [Azospirillum]ALJ35509.1 thioesterase-like protein [Azospirillum brasilense]MDW7555631.1 thioesterase family protein [Azospirillum brasilense]MDW7595558.1 thioesterase family protein [Azospirillum brasilense]MDW7630563.1 thioesterase family protein [Azospirillum brasilense]MDX5954241.1 thioesterase family protein [Azospirillum brasilense]
MNHSPTPLRLHRETVRPEWIDYNGHMNVAYYLLAFDHATDAVLDHFEIGKAYAEGEGRSMFAVEAHLTYAREVTEGDGLTFTSLVLGADAKRLHLFHEMRHEEDGFLAATAEFVLLHVDLAERRSVPLAPETAERLTRTVAEHATLPVPPQAGRSVGLRTPKGA